MPYKFTTTAARSELMKKIKSKNTAPEILLRKKIWNIGLRYTVNSKLPGKPDIVFSKKKVVIFVDGEFWHGKNWEVKKTTISANRSYWIPKIEKNISRDIQVNIELKELGFKVVRFWANDVLKKTDECFQIIQQELNGSQKAYN